MVKNLYMKNNKTIIIAEAGVNHNGSLKNIYKLINIAKNSGCDFVKFQSFVSENLVTANAKKADYQKRNYKKSISQQDMLKKFELTKINHLKIISYCKKKKIKPLFTPFDDESLDLVKSLKLNEIKIGSTDTNNLPFLRKIAKLNKITFFSTGMSNYQDIKIAVRHMLKNGLSKKNLFLLHCNTDYPTPNSDANLNVIPNIKKIFNLNVGFSDHTLGILAPLAAVSLGAKVIEKHFTIDKNLDGPDHAASLNPVELKDMVNKIRIIENLLGSSEKKITKSEKKNFKIVRKSIIAKKFIKKGEKFTEENLIIKRPGNGLPPIYFDKLIGKKATKNFKKDEFIRI